MSQFIDRVIVYVTAGSGGNGCSSVLREKFRPMGGPDGGNGGNGGSVIFEVSTNVHTLLDMHFHSHITAENGKTGQGGNKTGASGKDRIVHVPSGTVVFDEEGNMLADLTGSAQFIAAQGGKGGLGNAALASRTRKAPGFALLGEEGQSRKLIVELKSVADVGLLGFPSAGKSSLISVVSAAKPKIADYPFTTLTPNLGVVSAGDTTFTIADVPGLIPGASEGKGLGLEFLRHIERCAVLAHVVDCATFDPLRDPISDIEAIENELASYLPEREFDTGLGSLRERPRIIILNKIDVPDGAQMAKIVTEQMESYGWPIYPISAVTREGVDTLLYALADIVKQHRIDSPHINSARQRITLIDDAHDDSFTIHRDPHNNNGFIVTGTKPLRWVKQTPFDNDEAVGYLADRLAKLGVEEALLEHGAVEGSEVTIGDWTFDFEPSIATGAYIPRSGRGTDVRLDTHDRISADERKAARKSRRIGNHTSISSDFSADIFSNPVTDNDSGQ